MDEGKKILIQEFGKQYGTYFCILDQIAHGDVTQSEIEGALGMKSLGGQMESCRYKQIGGWWQPNGVNSKGNSDDFEIDIVTETLEGDVEAYEVKRNPQKYSPARLDEKVTEMKRRMFKGKEVAKRGLSMEDM